MNDALQVSDAEQFVIGAAMSGYPDLDELFELLEPADFYRPFNEAVWTAIQRVHRAGNQPEPVSVRLALTADSVKFDAVQLFDFVNHVPMVSQGGYYAQQVATASGLRRIQRAGVKVQQLGEVMDDLDEIREQARAAIDEATKGHTVTSARTLADILPSVIDTAQNGQSAVLSTGWPDLDRLVGGIAPGRLIVIGARPGVGKSVMGTNLALHFAARHHHAVLLASLEMPEDEVGQRLLAAHASANLTGLQGGDIDERAWNRIAEKLEELNGLPITIDDTAAQTITHIRRAARNVQRKRDDLALIIVDYLQLVTPTTKTTNRAEALGEISRGLKLLARETGACVVAMAQVNRESSKRNDAPKMSDLRESGSIEADADQVILLHQPDEKVPEIEVIVDKNRHGPKGYATLQIQGHYARLASIEWSPSRGIA